MRVLFNREDYKTHCNPLKNNKKKYPKNETVAA